jgi:hypothetical protein
MRDAAHPDQSDPKYAAQIVNMYPQDSPLGPVLVGRPGFSLMGAQLGTAGARTSQLIVQFTKRSGTEYRVQICDGLFYTWDGAAWNEVVTTANFTTAGITLSTTARCYAITFNDTLLISDGVGKPFTWDGTAGAGGLTSLTNAPVLYGQPVVYYAKWFGIKNTARQTIVWSEEAAANTGFEAGGYNNAWDLVQNQTEGLIALAATNEALYYFRQNSAGAIVGAVTTDFKTTGTREAISSGIGTLSPSGVLVSDNGVVFVDQFGTIQRARVGGGVTEIGLGFRGTMRGIPTSKLDDILALEDIEFDMIRFAIPGLGEDWPNQIFNLRRESGEALGIDTGFRFSAWGLLKDSDGTPTLVHGGGSTSATITDGYSYLHGHLDGSTWADGFNGGTIPITHQITTAPLGFDVSVEQAYVRGDFSIVPVTTMTGATLTFRTPTAVTSPITVATITSTGTPLGTFVLGTDTLADTPGERKVTWQMRVPGRGCTVGFSHGYSTERVQLNELALEATPYGQRQGTY